MTTFHAIARTAIAAAAEHKARAEASATTHALRYLQDSLDDLRAARAEWSMREEVAKAEREAHAEEMARYAGAVAYTHLCDMTLKGHLSPEAAMTPVLCYRETPLVTIKKVVRAGRRCTLVHYTYQL